MAVAFEPIRAEPAYRKVADALLARITDRTLNPGDRLPSETELARQFGVNRSTVREAMRELESQGLVGRSRGSKRMAVLVPAHEHIANGVSRALALHDVTAMHVWQALTVIEPQLAALAAHGRSNEDLEAMRSSATEFATMGAERARAVHCVAEFLHRLGSAAHNPVLSLAHQPLLQLLEPALGQMIDRVPQARTRIATAHRQLLWALERGDASEAERWMVKHVRDFRRGFELAGISLTEPIAVVPRAAVLKLSAR